MDGKQTYTVTREVLDKYRAYDFMDTLKRKREQVYALCSSNDELIGDSHFDLRQVI